MFVLFYFILRSFCILMDHTLYEYQNTQFRDLVRARYNTFFHRIEETIPLFRTTQWMWFITAIFYTYSDFVMDFLKSNTSLHYLLEYAYAWTIPGFAFLLYSGTFVLTIATMQRDHIRFQLNQLCWTILVLCLTVGQLKYIMHNVYNGLIWFGLPIMLVVSNDSFAWLFGVLCGRKFIHRDFISLSPNKTWEGFIGGWIGTMFMAWHLSRFMARFKWMTCPEKSISLWTKELDCQLDPIFEPATNIVPSQVFELFPSALMKMIPGIVDICMVNSDPNVLTPCISGEESHSHHHFELYLKNLYPVQIHALGLSLFASFVAPFGGFLASGIKRAYGLKDFGNYIPGHGGMMDRMDCQFLMALCVWVHYNTFVKMATVSVPKVFYFYKLMKDSEKEEFLMLVKQLENET
jgi:phosphatidate cytidylyltransferase